MQVLHGGGAEDDEESHPKGGALEWDGLIGLSLIGLIICLKNDCVEEQSEKPQHEQQLNHEDHEVLGVVLDSVPSLRSNDLIDVVEIHTAGEQQHDQENAGDLFVVLIENVCDGLDLILWNGFLQPWSDCHDKKGQASDPNDC